MRDYKGIPVWESDEIKESPSRKIYAFQNMMPIAVPANTSYAIVANGDEYFGIVVCNNGDGRFRKDKSERVFVRTCPSFIGMASRTDKCIEARI